MTPKEKRKAFRAKLEALRQSYLARVPATLAEARAAIEAGDFGRVAAISHAIRGTGGSYDLDGVVTLTKQLDEACADEDAGRAHQAIEGLESVVHRFTKADAES